MTGTVGMAVEEGAAVDVSAFSTSVQWVLFLLDFFSFPISKPQTKTDIKNETAETAEGIAVGGKTEMPLEVADMLHHLRPKTTGALATDTKMYQPALVLNEGRHPTDLQTLLCQTRCLPLQYPPLNLPTILNHTSRQ